MSSHNSDIIRYLLYRLRKEASEERSSQYHDLFKGLKRELQSSLVIDLRPSTRSSWLRVQDYLDDEDVMILVRAFEELDLLKLTHLDLSHNRIGERSVVALAGSLRQVYLPELIYLDLSHNQIGERSVIELAGVLERGYLSGLTWLDLSQNAYSSTSNGEKESNALARAIMSGNLSHLHHLGLPPCSVDGVVSAFWEGRIRSLSHLQLSGYFSDVPRARLASIGELFLIVRQMPLEHIHLRRCGLTWDVMEDFMRALVSGNDSHQYLQHLDLSENCLGVRGVVALGRVMKEGHLGNLSHLSLGSCGIEEIYQLRALEEGIRSGNMSKLTYLDLSSNKLGFLGTCSLVNMIEGGLLSNLLHLDLSDCNMRMMAGLETLRPGKLLRTRSYLEQDERDVLDFIASLKKGHLSRLRVLDLSFNKLSTRGCIVLAGVIQGGGLPDLHQLHLCGCGIKDNGILSLVEAMQDGQLHRLQYLDLGFNKFDEPGVETIAGALAEGRLSSLRFLNLYLLRQDGVPFDREAVASTYESIYGGGGEASRSLLRDKDMLVRISFFWAKEKRQDRLARREAIMPYLASGLADAFSQNNKLTTTIVGLGEYDSLLHECRQSNLQVRVHSQPPHDSMASFATRFLVLTVALLSLAGLYWFMV